MKRKLIFVLVVLLAVTIVPSAFAKSVLRLGIGDPEGSNAYIQAERFKDLMEAYTEGDVSVRLFPNCQLGSEQEMAQNVRLGTLDMALFGSSNLAPFVPALNITTLPYLVMSNDDAVKMTSGKIGEFMNQAAIEKAGVRIVGWTLDGFRRVSNSKRAVKTLQELKGLKIRTPKNPVMLACYRSWGINAVPMAWDETFTALQQGVIDGQDVPYMLFKASKFYEVQKYITNTRFNYIMQQMIIGEKKFQSMSKDMQALILRCGVESSEFVRQHFVLKEAEVKQWLIDKGMVIVDPANDEKEWVERGRSVWPQFYNLVGGEAKFKELYGYMK